MGTSFSALRLVSPSRTNLVLTRRVVERIDDGDRLDDDVDRGDGVCPPDLVVTVLSLGDVVPLYSDREIGASRFACGDEDLALRRFVFFTGVDKE